MKCREFDRILKELNQRPTQLNKWLEDRRLTALEKKILLGHSWIRNNQNQKVLEEILSLSASETEFIEGHRALLIGIACNNLSHFERAQEHLARATLIFSALELQYYKFLGHFNLFILASNRVDLPEMEKQLLIMRQIPFELPLQQLRLHRCEFIFADESNRPTEARRWLEEIHKQDAIIPEADRISHLVSELMFLVKQRELQDARDVLEQMKKHRKFQLSENFNYMKKLLDHLIDGRPIYAYAVDFEQVPYLFHQLQVIQALEAGDQDLAQEHWANLGTSAPELYGNSFDFKGPTSLFSLCLEKHLPKLNSTPVDHVSGENKVELLVELLKAYPAGLKKAHLYELIWRETIETKSDLQKLARLVYRARQNMGIEIQTRKGSYILMTEAPKRRAG